MSVRLRCTPGQAWIKSRQNPSRLRLKEAKRGSFTRQAQRKDLDIIGSSSQNDSSSLEERIETNDYSKFVSFLHLASPYVQGHRGRLMVLAIPGEVVVRPDRLYPLLEDVLLLHGLGIRLLLVVGVKPVIDKLQRQAGHEPEWVGAYRITDGIAIKAAIEAAGTISTEISARLSRAPSIPMVRRHARGEGQMHFAPAVQVITGNFVTAKKRGIINGVDFGYAGQVRFVQTEPIRQQLEAGNIVLLTNIGISASGELLNCNLFDVSTHAAVELKADKLICMTGDDVRALNLPHYLPMDDAQELIARAVCADSDASDDNCVADPLLDQLDSNGNGSYNGSTSSSSNGTAVEMALDLDGWQQIGFPNAVLAAVVACKNGVNRAHLVDIESDGAMLLELYTRDGINGVCMIAADLYEGIRRAEIQDVPGIVDLLNFLVSSGIDVPFAPEQIGDMLEDATVIDREGKLLGCAVTQDLGKAPDGERVYEVSAFVIHPSYRCQGHGDSMLDWVEQDLRRKGARRVVILAGQGSYEWFVQRGFENAGDASSAHELLPARRRHQIPPVCKLFVKKIMELDASLGALTPGKRIGF